MRGVWATALFALADAAVRGCAPRDVSVRNLGVVACQRRSRHAKLVVIDAGNWAVSKRAQRFPAAKKLGSFWTWMQKSDSSTQVLLSQLVVSANHDAEVIRARSLELLREWRHSTLCPRPRKRIRRRRRASGKNTSRHRAVDKARCRGSTKRPT